MVSTTLLLPVLVVTIAFIIVSVTVRGKGQHINRAQILAQPKMGGTTKLIQQQGPWPECLGISGSECQQLIEAVTEDVVGNIYILPEDSMMTMDYRTNRVRILVNENNIVTKIPSRG